jgi:hypothetical protein
VDDIGEHVARRLRGLGLVDTRQIVGLAATGPGLKALGPGVELLRRIAGLELVIALLQPRIDEVADDVGDRGIFAVLGEHDGRLELAQQCDEFRHAETVMPHLDHVTQRAPSSLRGSSSRNLPKSASSNFLVGANCHSTGPSRSPSSSTPES